MEREREGEERASLLGNSRVSSDGHGFRVCRGTAIALLSLTAIVATLAVVAHTRRRSESEHGQHAGKDGSGKDGSLLPIVYTEWPPPQTALAVDTMRALGLHEPASSFDLKAVPQKMAELAPGRALAGMSPPILVLAGADWPYGLGNIFAGLASSAVLAEALGGACVATLGSHYAIGLLPFLSPKRPTFAFPCVLVDLDRMAQLRFQSTVPVISLHNWQVLGPNTTGPFIIDTHTRYHESKCLERPDISHLTNMPPGMAPGEFWRRVRSKYEEWLFTHLRIPIEPHEHRIEPFVPWASGEGTVCGHMRLGHKEAHIEKELSCKMVDCGGVLSVMERMQRIRPARSYFVASGGNCSMCLPSMAPTLLASAALIVSGHISKKLTERGAGFDDARGAASDLRALARCSVVIVDDKPAGTFALTVAAAGKLAPCSDPLAWPDLGTTQPRTPSQLDMMQGLDKKSNFRLRALCKTNDPSQPASQPVVLSQKVLRRLAASVRFDVSKPWWPRLLPPASHRASDTPYAPSGCEDAYKPWNPHRPK